MASAAVLYTPEVLSLATALADWPLLEEQFLRGEARSRSCGSSLIIGLAMGREGGIERLGLSARACAIGQAAAAIFAGSARGETASTLAESETAIATWLAGAGPMPAWPGLAAIAPAAAYPGRHGAILLPWKAARAALSTCPEAG